MPPVFYLRIFNFRNFAAPPILEEPLSVRSLGYDLFFPLVNLVVLLDHSLDIHGRTFGRAL